MKAHLVHDLAWPQRNSADEFRVFCLQHQYNRNVTYNEDRLRDAAAFLSRVREFVTTIDAHVSKLRDLDARSTNGGGNPEAALPLEMREAASVQEADRALRDALHRTKARIRDALATDFDTPTCVAALTELVREGYKALEAGARSDVLQVTQVCCDAVCCDASVLRRRAAACARCE